MNPEPEVVFPPRAVWVSASERTELSVISVVRISKTGDRILLGRLLVPLHKDSFEVHVQGVP